VVPASVPLVGSPTKYRPWAAEIAVQPDGQTVLLKNITAVLGTPPPPSTAHTHSPDALSFKI